ncbi:MAG: DinB family protein [Phycisphaeraceae bacterium]|nr:DinB family protein [Phycisphaeraceae bacterium]
MSDTRTEGCCQGSAKGENTGCCGGAGGPPAAMSVDELKALPTLQLIARYRRGIENFDRRVFELTEEQIDMAFLPDAGVGRWPVRVLIGHCADADLASVHRMRRAVAEDQPLLSNWDEDAFVDANLYGNRHEGYAADAEADHARVMHALGGHMAVIHTLRQWTGAWLTTLEESQLDRVAMHPEKGEQSVRTMLAMYTWHLEHHAAFLRRKLDRMLGPPVEPEKVAAVGCGGGCACKG